MNEIVVAKKVNLVSVVDGLALTPRTKETYKFHMISFTKFCEEGSLEIGLESAKDWIASSKTNSTYSARKSALKKVLREAFKGNPGLIEMLEYLHELKPAKRDLAVSTNKYLTVDELNKMIEVSPPKIGVVIKALFETALRISELISMKVDEIYPIGNGDVYEIMIRAGKGNKENLVHISKKLYEEIVLVFQGEEYLFETNGHSFSRQYLSREITKAGKKIDRKISAHTLRHSRANDLLSRDVPINKVSKFLRHASINTTCAFYDHQKPTFEELGIV